MPPDNEEILVPGPAEAVQETNEARDLLRVIHSSIGRFLEGDTRRRETESAPPARIETGIPGIDSMMRGGLPLGMLTELYGDERTSGVGAAFTLFEERRSFTPPEGPANPGPAAFGTWIHNLPVWEENDLETIPAAVSEEPPVEFEPYILWLHQLDIHTNWIRTSHNNWVVRHALGRVYIKSPTGFYRRYRARGRNQCPSAVQEDIARWLLDAAGPGMHHELLEGPLAVETGWFPIGESSEWSFRWNDQSDTMAVLHDNTGLFFYYDDEGGTPPLPFDVLNAAMQLHNRLQPREVADASGNIYTLRLSFDPLDVICQPTPEDSMDDTLTEYIARFRDSLDNLYNAPLVNFDPSTDVGIDAKPVEGQSRWKLVEEDHAPEE